jgi:pentatricopeptide repeat protein
MEAKETAKAELGIAFEMLKMMKERGLRADPEAYQCLIDACGRCGDTDRATQLLSRMHEDGIVADGVVYSSLVAAFSADNAWKQASGEVREELPEWANGASIDMDWNTLKTHKRSYIDIVKEKFGATEENGEVHPAGLKNTFNRIMARNKANQQAKKGMAHQNSYTEQFVTDQVLRQILLGENLLEIVYPDISIDTDNEFCPRCNFYLSDDDVVAGWSAGNTQEYKTQCPNCLTNFVPHFCVQSTLPSFVGSRGPSSPLFCERLSPWVLKKELRSVISGGIENLLSPEWREKESKNAVLWWNLILSFMRYRFPFTFLLQGSFDTSLIAPTPDDDQPLSP